MNIRYFLFVCVLILNCSNIISQNEIFNFEGSVNLMGQLSDRQGVGSQVPQNYLRSNGNATLSYSFIPVDLRYSLSTENSSFKQRINRASVSLNVPMMKQNFKAIVDDKIASASNTNEGPTDKELSEFKDEVISEYNADFLMWKEYFNTSQGQIEFDQLKAYDRLLKLESSPTTKENFEKFEQLVDNTDELTTEELEMKDDLHQYVLTTIRQLKKKDKIASEFGNSLDEIYSGYLSYLEGEESYEEISISDYKKANSSFNPYAFLNKTQQVLDMFQGVSFGSTNPYFSRLSLSSLIVNGVSVELNPGKFYFSGVIGRSARQATDLSFTIPQITLSQNMYGIKAGYGSANDTHLHFSFIDIADASGISNTSLVNPPMPNSNRLIGVDGKISLLANQLSLEGEWVGSLISYDKQAIPLSEENQVDSKLSALFPNTNSTSSFDIAYRLAANYNLQSHGIMVSGELERVNPEYFSLGAPTIISNVERWNLNLRKSFFNNRVQAGLIARRDNNSIDPFYSSIINTTESFGFDVNIAFPDYPQIFASYSPLAQRSEILKLSESRFSDTDLYSLAISYPYTINESLSANTQLTYNSHSINSNIPDANSSNRTYGINQSLNYKAIGVSASYSFAPDQQFAETIQDVSTLNVNANWNVDKINLNGGFQLFDISNQESKTGYQLNATYQLTEQMSALVRAQRNVFSSVTNVITGFQENILQAGLNINFGIEKQETDDLNNNAIYNDEVIASADPEFLDRIDEFENPVSEEVALDEVIENLDEVTPVVVEAELENEKSSEEVDELSKTPEINLIEDKEELSDALEIESESDEVDEVIETTLELSTDEKIEEKKETIKATSQPKEFQVNTEKNIADQYRILIDVDLRDDKDFMSLIDVGPVYSEPSSDGQFYQYFIGQEDDEEKAKLLLEKVKRRGFDGAKVIGFKNGEAISDNVNRGNEIEIDRTFHILFNVLDNSDSEFPELSRLGNVFTSENEANGFVRYLIGSESNLMESVILLDQVRNAGYRSAVIVFFENGEFIGPLRD